MYSIPNVTLSRHLWPCLRTALEGASTTLTCSKLTTRTFHQFPIVRIHRLPRLPRRILATALQSSSLSYWSTFGIPIRPLKSFHIYFVRLYICCREHSLSFKIVLSNIVVIGYQCIVQTSAFYRKSQEMTCLGCSATCYKLVEHPHVHKEAIPQSPSPLLSPLPYPKITILMILASFWWLGHWKDTVRGWRQEYTCVVNINGGYIIYGRFK